MKHIPYISLLVMLLGLASCITPFEPDFKQEVKPRLVVEGHIYLDKISRFTLYLSQPLDNNQEVGHYDYAGIGSEAAYRRPGAISTAKINVKGSDGSLVYGMWNSSDHTYDVDTRDLNPELEYCLQIHYDDELFESEPLKALDASLINSVDYEQMPETKNVNILVSISNPNPEEEMYLKLRYDEAWEIYTPMNSNGYYDAEKDMVISIKNNIEYGHGEGRRDHGWGSNNTSKPVVVNSNPYEDKSLTKYSLYAISHTNDRLQTCYRTRIYAEAITPAEYEYEKIKEKQANQMGGIFSPLPNELPTNIHSLNGDTKVIGFVGVRGRVSMGERYIKKYDVEYKNMHGSCKWLEDSFVNEHTPATLYSMGYQVCMVGFVPFKESFVQWCPNWGVDCTDRVWGAKREMPEGWNPDNTTNNNSWDGEIFF